MNTQAMLKEISRLMPGSTTQLKQVVKARQSETHTQLLLECVLAIRQGKPLPDQLPNAQVVKAYLNLTKAARQASRKERSRV